MENSMKRFFVSAGMQFLVFGLVGGSTWTAAGLILFAFMFWHSDLSFDTAVELAKLFPTVFSYTIVYAAGIAAIDFVVEWLRLPHRAVICALVSLLLLDWLCVSVPDPSRISAAKLAAISLLGALPAALCSWLCAGIASRYSAGNWPSPPQASVASPG
jgi:hypothetical protein